MMQVLKQCDGNVSREDVMHPAANLHAFEIPTLLPGRKVITKPVGCLPSVRSFRPLCIPGHRQGNRTSE